jgi:hypothetical protein
MPPAGRPDVFEFDQGAGAALRWLVCGGPAPLTGSGTGPGTGPDTGRSPPPAAAVVRELAAAEDLIYQRRSPRREFARGVLHALMWAQYATAAPPVPAARCPPPAS